MRCDRCWRSSVGSRLRARLEVTGCDGILLEAAQQVRRAARHLLMQLDEDELRGPNNRDDEMEPALRGSNTRRCRYGIADRVSLELMLGRSFAFNLGQPRDSMKLQATMQQ